jgi:hypothetical protein
MTATTKAKARAKRAQSSVFTLWLLQRIIFRFKRGGFPACLIKDFSHLSLCVLNGDPDSHVRCIRLLGDRCFSPFGLRLQILLRSRSAYAR